ncbi:MFS transporter [Streptomyces violaceusniger]
MTAVSGGSAGRWALAAVSATVFCVQLDAFALNLALPAIGRDLGAAGGGLQWVVSGYLLAAGALMAGAGRLGDLYGRRRLLTAGLAVFGGASLVCAWPRRFRCWWARGWCRARAGRWPCRPVSPC